MDVMSVVGVLIGCIAILGGNWIEGGSITALLNAPAALIVMGGTLGAASLQTPLPVLQLAAQRMRWVFMPPNMNFQAGIDKIVRWAMAARKEGLLGLETIADSEADRFARKGLQLLVDGSEPDSIRAVMELESDLRQQRDVDAAKFYESMGGYSPTIGIIGAVMGLIHVFFSDFAAPHGLPSMVVLRYGCSIKPVSFNSIARGFSPSAMEITPSTSISRYSASRLARPRNLLATGSRNKLAIATP